MLNKKYISNMYLKKSFLLAVTEFQWNNIMKLVRDGYEKCHFFIHTFVTLVLGRH